MEDESCVENVGLLKTMKVLITGIDGYIGVLLAQALIERGHDVVGLDTGFYRSGWMFNGVSRLPETLSKDTRIIKIKDLKGFDAVVHLAELSNDPLGNNNFEVTRSINYHGSVKLAKKAKKAGVKKFIYSSSCSVYGVANSDYVTEESMTHPQTEYAKCKVRVEKELLRLADQNFSPTILRNATAYGASPRMRFDLVLNNLAGLAWVTKEIKLTSDGTPWRPFVHVVDLCEAFVLCLEAPRRDVHNETFNVGDRHGNYQIREIAQIVAKIFPGCKLTFGKKDGDDRSYKVSFEKINKKLPKFECKWTVKTGAEQLYALFKKINLDKESFEARSFTRLKQLDYLIETNQLDESLFWTKS